MSEKDEKSIQYTGELLPIDMKEEISGEDIVGLKDEELNQATGGYFPIFDECQKSFHSTICIKGISGHFLGYDKQCPNFEFTKKTLYHDRYLYQWGRCKKGYFGEQKLFLDGTVEK